MRASCPSYTAICWMNITNMPCRSCTPCLPTYSPQQCVGPWDDATSRVPWWSSLQRASDREMTCCSVVNTFQHAVNDSFWQTEKRTDRLTDILSYSSLVLHAMHTRRSVKISYYLASERVRAQRDYALLTSHIYNTRSVV